MRAFLPANGGREKRGVSQWGRVIGKLLFRGQRGNKIQNFQTRNIRKKQGATLHQELNITVYLGLFFCTFCILAIVTA
jgi:hypothetical protein